MVYVFADDAVRMGPALLLLIARLRVAPIGPDPQLLLLKFAKQLSLMLYLSQAYPELVEVVGFLLLLLLLNDLLNLLLGILFLALPVVHLHLVHYQLLHLAAHPA